MDVKLQNFNNRRKHSKHSWFSSEQLFSLRLDPAKRIMILIHLIMIFLKMRTNFYTSSKNLSRILKENYLQTVKPNENRMKLESSHSS